MSGARTLDQVGYAVGSAGDINGDGIPDMIVGAPRAPRENAGGREQAGEAYVVFGRVDGLPSNIDLADLLPENGGDGTEGFVIRGIDPNDQAGEAIQQAGDFNGDGIDDVLIGAYRASSGGREGAGESFVVYGRATPFPPVFELATLLPAGGGDGSEGFVIRGPNDSTGVGKSVGAAGDFNGDGIHDIIVGASRRRAGTSYVVFGRPGGVGPVLDLRSLLPEGGGDGSAGVALQGFTFGEGSGTSVSGVGDVNGDGVDDVIIGAPGAPNGFGIGWSYVVFGSDTGFPAVFRLGSLLPVGGGDGSRGFVISGVRTTYRTGLSVSGAGDVNGDGISDVIVGAPRASPGGQTSAGESYVVFGRSTGFPAEVSLRDLLPGFGGDGSEGFVLAGLSAFAESGSAVSGIGDLNGDGVDDVAIGASREGTPDRLSAGETYVVFGRSTGFPPLFPLARLQEENGGDGREGVIIQGIDQDDSSGTAIGPAGDVNGDGIEDIIIGAPFAGTNDRSSSGECYVVFGRSDGFPAALYLGDLLTF